MSLLPSSAPFDPALQEQLACALQRFGLPPGYDMFWSMYGGNVAWLYVRPEHRGSGVVVSIVAQICAEVRKAGGEFLHGGRDDDIERLYERTAVRRPTHECHVSEEAFQVFADLAGLSPREIVRRLPSSELNLVPARLQDHSEGLKPIIPIK